MLSPPEELSQAHWALSYAQLRRQQEPRLSSPAASPARPAARIAYPPTINMDTGFSTPPGGLQTFGTAPGSYPPQSEPSPHRLYPESPRERLRGLRGPPRSASPRSSPYRHPDPL